MVDMRGFTCEEHIVGHTVPLSAAANPAGVAKRGSGLLCKCMSKTVSVQMDTKLRKSFKGRNAGAKPRERLPNGRRPGLTAEGKGGVDLLGVELNQPTEAATDDVGGTIRATSPSPARRRSATDKQTTRSASRAHHVFDCCFRSIFIVCGLHI